MVVSHDGDEITNVTMSDHDRLGWEAVMAALFALFLLLFAGPAGIRAILSFVVTVLAIWKVLIPLYLRVLTPSGWTCPYLGAHGADYCPGLWI